MSPAAWWKLKRRKLQLMGEMLSCLSLWGFNSQKCKSYIWNKNISWKKERFSTFLFCLCKVKDVGSKSSWKELFLQSFHLLSTVALMSRPLAHAVHTHYKIKDGLKVFQSKTVMIWKPEYMPNSLRSSDPLKVKMVCLVQSMRDKERSKVDEFWRGPEDFPI